MNPIFSILIVVATYFNVAENPLSEGGRWTHEASAWHVVKTQGGLAMPSAVNQGYDDSYSLLSGFPPDVSVTAKIYRAPGVSCAESRELELLLRMEDTPTTVRGYEVLFSCTERVAYVVRWNGAMGDFTVIGQSFGSFDLANGDVLSATIQGSTITAYRNGTLVAQANDSTFATGQPGMGMFWRGGGKAKDLAFANYKATGL